MSVLLPINTTETWQSHFTSRGWSTPQDQVSAGYPLFILPSNGTGYYEETFDYGTILASSKITVDIGGQIISGLPAVDVTISTSDDNVTWVSNSGSTEAYATNFRYVKVRITTTESTGDGLYQIDNLNVRLDAKQITDSGAVACVSTDASGTIVNFGKTFIDVTSITVSPSGTTPLVPVYDFQDAVLTGTYSVASNVCTVNVTGHGLLVGQNVRLGISTGTAPLGVYTVASVPSANQFTVSMTTSNTSGNLSIYPESFRVYLFNSSGTRVNGTVSWSIRGY